MMLHYIRHTLMPRSVHWRTIHYISVTCAMIARIALMNLMEERGQLHQLGLPDRKRAAGGFLDPTKLR